MLPSELTDRIRSHLLASLPVTPFQQDGEVWHATLDPLDSAKAPEPLQHLDLSVMVRELSESGLYERGQQQVVRCVVEVSAYYRLRSLDGTTLDVERASDAGAFIRMALLDEELWTSFEDDELISIGPTTIGPDGSASYFAQITTFAVVNLHLRRP